MTRTTAHRITLGLAGGAALFLVAAVAGAASAEGPPPAGAPGFEEAFAPGPHAEREGRGPGRGGVERALGMMRAADADGDRVVTRAEVQSLRVEMFAWLDRNADGVLDLADRSPVEQRLAALPAPEGAADRPRRRRDGDRSVTREQFLEDDLPLFDRIDSDENGAVTETEVEAFVGRVAMMSRWGRGR